MVFIIALRSDEHFQDILVCVLLDLSEPRLHIIKRRHVSRVKGEQNAISSLVIRLSDCAEPFLASCVPNIESGMTNLTSY